MNLYLYNSFTNRKEEFISLVPNKVSMYACGVTDSYLREPLKAIMDLSNIL